MYFSAIAFLKIRVPDEDLTPNMPQNFHILDQTRIHHESYKLAIKIVMDTSQSDGAEQGDKHHNLH